ncbi:MAG: SOS response-associated peptidase [Betaproteobacteria bacterium]|nr:SOS response-associated peptidase [Betaproteobacteria bacterium]
MCGRYVSPGQAAIESIWHVGRRNQPALGQTEPVIPFPARYNVAPQQGKQANYIPVLRQAPEGELELARLQWWLLPFWSKEPRIKFSTFNARVETVANAASFREPFKRRRCIVPALGWYEWQELPSGNLPWFLHAATGELLAFAALWDHWEARDGSGQVIESCSLVVGPANAVFMPIHDRMPFVLDEEQQALWLDRSLNDPREVMEVLRPNRDDAIAFHRVGPRVSNARNQGPELMAPLAEADAPDSEGSGTPVPGN